MLQRLRTIVYQVHDLSVSTTWYTSLKCIEPYFDEPFYCGFKINGCELGLDPDMTYVEKGNYTTAYWSVVYIHAAVAKAVAIGSTLIDPVNNVGGTIEVATIADPFGN